ncbi:MAG: phosphatase PAP2 family protein [Jatrophihabitans sp.]
MVSAVVAVLLGVVTALVVTRTGPVVRLDRWIEDTVHRYALRHDGFVTAMKAVSVVGTSHVWWVVFAGLAGWLLYRRSARLAAFVLVTSIASSALNTVVKGLVDRPRPTFAHPVATASGSSFPSGHAQAAIVGCGVVLAVVLPRVQRWIQVGLVAATVLITLTIGLSRIALGVHFPSDVVGGYLLGALWVLVLGAAFGLSTPRGRLEA